MRRARLRCWSEVFIMLTLLRELTLPARTPSSKDCCMTANGIALSDEARSATRTAPVPGARWALILLLAINLFNYIDRYVLSSVAGKIEEQLLPGDEYAK